MNEKQVAEEYLLHNFIYMKFNKAKLNDLLFRDTYICDETIKKSKGTINSKFRLMLAFSEWGLGKGQES